MKTKTTPKPIEVPLGRTGDWTVEAGDWTVVATIRQSDELGCLLSEVRAVRATPLPDAGKPWAAGLTAKVRCLGEDLAMLESDAKSGAVLLRSQTPESRDDGVLYFEGVLQGASVFRLNRWLGSHAPGIRRRAVDFALTRESLARLVRDLTSE